MRKEHGHDIMSYPSVVNEFETLDLILAGKSIARYGDGEFSLVRGGNCVSQKHNKSISQELGKILSADDKRCLIGIPRLDPQGPKNANWTKLSAVYSPHLVPKKTYYSAFVTRPDSAPWIATKEYFDKVESLWTGKKVTMVYGSERSLSLTFPPMQSARAITVVQAPYRDAYDKIDEIERDIEYAGNVEVLLMVGPTATCLAHRLAKKDYHAIDLGHIGMFWRPYENEKLSQMLKLPVLFNGRA